MVSLVERKSLITLIASVASKASEVVTSAIIDLLLPYKQHVRTLTFDNGKEFSNHGTIAKSLSAETYFCHPYHSWERGTNENANGLIRQYFPKKRELLSVEDDELTEAMRRIDNRPRKILGWKTPIQVFTDNYKSVALQC